MITNVITSTYKLVDGNVQTYNLSSSPPTLMKSVEAHYSKDNHSTYSANAPCPSSSVTHLRIKRDLPHLVSSGCDGSVAIWDLSRDCKVFYFIYFIIIYLFYYLLCSFILFFFFVHLLSFHSFRGFIYVFLFSFLLCFVL